MYPESDRTKLIILKNQCKSIIKTGNNDGGLEPIDLV